MIFQGDRMKRVLLFVLLVLAGAAGLLAQNSDLALHLYANLSLPTGEFGKDTAYDSGPTRRFGYALGDKVGLAQTGYGLGAELIAPVWFKGLQWIFSANVITNGINSQVAKDSYRSRLGHSVQVDFDFGRWLNVPVMTGFRYDHYFTHQYALYGMVQAGINFSMAPSKKVTVNNIVGDETTYESARDFGYQMGLGLLYNQTYNLSVRYMALSTPRFDGRQKLSERVFPNIFTRENTILGEERAISMVMVTFGIQLFR
jgi:hypothetical protein